MTSLSTQLEAHRAVMVQVIEERDKAVRERDAAERMLAAAVFSLPGAEMRVRAFAMNETLELQVAREDDRLTGDVILVARARQLSLTEPVA